MKVLITHGTWMQIGCWTISLIQIWLTLFQRGYTSLVVIFAISLDVHSMEYGALLSSTNGVEMMVFYMSGGLILILKLCLV